MVPLEANSARSEMPTWTLKAERVPGDLHGAADLQEGEEVRFHAEVAPLYLLWIIRSLTQFQEEKIPNLVAIDSVLKLAKKQGNLSKVVHRDGKSTLVRSDMSYGLLDYEDFHQLFVPQKLEHMD